MALLSGYTSAFAWLGSAVDGNITPSGWDLLGPHTPFSLLA